MILLNLGRPVARAIQLAARAVPADTAPFWGDVFLDWLRQDPGPSAAVLHGLFFGRVAPPQAERKTFDVPTLVIGHPRDPVHPFSDADALARELPQAQLLDANSFFELRFWPERLTGEISGFIDDCWRPRKAAGRRAAAGRRKGA
jgi:pimeloyl-ACP methyl ester carboxylesterase